MAPTSPKKGLIIGLCKFADLQLCLFSASLPDLSPGGIFSVRDRVNDDPDIEDQREEGRGL